VLVLLPDSKIKNLWSYVLIFLFAYTAFVTPVRITFVDYVDTPWLVMDSIIDFLFFMDMIINLCSAYYDTHGDLVIDHRRIVEAYLKGWFIVDLLSIFPFDLALGNGYDSY
jgi:hypothetical protein